MPSYDNFSHVWWQGKVTFKGTHQDSREKIVALAKKCGMTRQSVYSKLSKFRRKGVRFTVDLDPREIGLRLRAYILIVAEPQTKFRRETNKLITKFEEISQIHYPLGRFDIILEVIVRDIDELRGLLRKIQNLPAVKKKRPSWFTKRPSWSCRRPRKGRHPCK